MKTWVTTTVLAGLACAAAMASTARAEGAPPAMQAGGSFEVAPSGPPVVEETAQTGRGIEYGVHLLVPVPLHGLFARDMQMGVGVQGRVGWEFPGGLSIEASLGYQGMGAQRTDEWIFDLFFGAGARFAFLNPSPLVPFVGAGVQLALWNIGQNAHEWTGPSGQDYCSTDWICGSDFGGLGVLVTGTAGAWYEVSVNLAFEGGVQYAYQLNDGPWSSTRDGGHGGFLVPFAGLTLFY